MNPFELKPKQKNLYYGLNALALKSYDKYETDPYTKTRIILMNGTEFESNWFYHQFARHCRNKEILKVIAEIRRSEQQQQKRIGSLKPVNESILETTLSYEQLAVDLTAILAKREKDSVVKKQLDYALLEDFDHLYRFTDMLEMDEKQNYKKLIGSYTEIMPGRPTIAEHRSPEQDLKLPINASVADPITKLNVCIITAAEQQTMNYYMNVAGFYHKDHGRKLFSEIAMIEEQHVSGYESLKDPTKTWLECAVMNEYTECYLYYSCMQTEKDPKIKEVWERHYENEVCHLKIMSDLLLKYEGRHYKEEFPNPEFPELLDFKENKKYIREVLQSVRLSADGVIYPNIDDLPSSHPFFKYQKAVVGNNPDKIPSHKIIKDYIAKYGEDLRYEVSPHPIPALRDKKVDNFEIARVKGK